MAYPETFPHYPQNKRNLSTLYTETHKNQQDIHKKIRKFIFYFRLSLWIVISNPGFPFKVKSARSPFSNNTLPAAAIIAALSVHNDNGGMTISTSSSVNALDRASLSPLFAATPPASSTCFTPY